jgi:hypothetical protein
MLIFYCSCSDDEPNHIAERSVRPALVSEGTTPEPTSATSAAPTAASSRAVVVP